MTDGKIPILLENNPMTHTKKYNVNPNCLPLFYSGVDRIMRGGRGGWRGRGRGEGGAGGLWGGGEVGRGLHGGEGVVARVPGPAVHSEKKRSLFKKENKCSDKFTFPQLTDQQADLKGHREITLPMAMYRIYIHI